MTAKNETKKEWLSRYRNAKAQAAELEEELYNLRVGKMCPSNIITDMPSGGSGDGDLSSYVAAVDNLMSKIIQNRYKQVMLYTNISDAIDVLEDDVEKRILRLRYLQGMKWEEVIIRIGYDDRQVYRIHGNALHNIKIKDVSECQ